MSKEYEVGWGKPPEHTRFAKGRSGNPKGRPKGTKNFASDLREELTEPIAVKEGGVTKRITKQRAIIKRLLQRALEGDPRALSTTASLARTELADEIAASPDLSAEDDEILARYLGKQRRAPDGE